jgi:hypothetical protein
MANDEYMLVIAQDGRLAALEEIGIPKIRQSFLTAS